MVQGTWTPPAAAKNWGHDLSVLSCVDWTMAATAWKWCANQSPLLWNPWLDCNEANVPHFHVQSSHRGLRWGISSILGSHILEVQMGHHYFSSCQPPSARWILRNRPRRWALVSVRLKTKTRDIIFLCASWRWGHWANMVERCVCLDRLCLWSPTLSIVLLCAQRWILKQKVAANQPISDILTQESGVETAFCQLPSVSCCFSDSLSPIRECPLISVESRHHRWVKYSLT